MYIPINQNSRHLRDLKNPTSQVLLLMIAHKIDPNFTCLVPTYQEIGHPNNNKRRKAIDLLINKGFIKTWVENKHEGTWCKLQPYCDIIDHKAFKRYLVESGIIEPVEAAESVANDDTAEIIPAENHVMVNGKPFKCPDWLEVDTLQSWVDHLNEKLPVKTEDGKRINAQVLHEDLAEFKRNFDNYKNSPDQEHLYIRYITSHNISEFKESCIVKHLIAKGCIKLSEFRVGECENPENTITPLKPSPPTKSAKSTSKEWSHTSDGERYPREWIVWFDSLTKYLGEPLYPQLREELYWECKETLNFSLNKLKKISSKIAPKEWCLDKLFSAYNAAENKTRDTKVKSTVADQITPEQAREMAGL